MRRPSLGGMEDQINVSSLTGTILLSQLGPLPQILPDQLILPLHHLKCSPPLLILLPFQLQILPHVLRVPSLHTLLPFLQQVMWGLLQRKK